MKRTPISVLVCVQSKLCVDVCPNFSLADDTVTTVEDIQVEKFDIPFEVPYNGATRVLSGITSHTEFKDFLPKLSDRTGIRLSLLARIGYVASWKPKSPKPVPRMLEDEQDWHGLIKEADDFRKACKGKNKGNGVIKPFQFVISDTSVGDGKEGAKKVSPSPS